MMLEGEFAGLRSPNNTGFSVILLSSVTIMILYLFRIKVSVPDVTN